jgi:hypothetical protein
MVNQATCQNNAAKTAVILKPRLKLKLLWRELMTSLRNGQVRKRKMMRKRKQRDLSNKELWSASSNHTVVL